MPSGSTHAREQYRNNDIRLGSLGYSIRSLVTTDRSQRKGSEPKGNGSGDIHERFMAGRACLTAGFLVGASTSAREAHRDQRSQHLCHLIPWKSVSFDASRSIMV